MSWFEESGGKRHKAVELFEDSISGWGLRVSACCPAGTRLVTTPQRLLFESSQTGARALPFDLLPACQSLRGQLQKASLSHSPWFQAVQLPAALPLLLADRLAQGEEVIPRELRSASSLESGRALHAALQSLEFDSWDALLWSQAAMMSRAAVLPRGSQRLVLAPMCDFANHARSFHDATAELRAVNDDVTLVALRNLAPGEEITHCYAEMGNEQLLFGYGMVLSDNPHSRTSCSWPQSPHRLRLLQKYLSILRGEDSPAPASFTASCFDELLAVAEVGLKSDQEVREALAAAAPSHLVWCGHAVRAAADMLHTWEQSLQASVAACIQESQGHAWPLWQLQNETLHRVAAVKERLLLR